MPRYLVGFVLFLLALGTLRTVGCNNDPCGGCDDGDRCTRDWCDYVNTSGTMSCNPEDYEYQCQHSRLPNGTACGGENVCVGGDCTENLCLDCKDDGNSCTIDCDYETGACDYLAVRDGIGCEDDGREGECYEGVCCETPACGEECGAGEAIDGSYTTSVGTVNCNALDMIQVLIEVVLAAKSESADGSEADVRISLRLDEDTIGDLGALVQKALIGEAWAEVGDVPLAGGVNVPAAVPCAIDFTADPDENGTAGPVEVVTPAVLNTFAALDGSTVVEVLDITLAISRPVPLRLTTKGDDAPCHWVQKPTVTLPDSGAGAASDIGAFEVQP